MLPNRTPWRRRPRAQLGQAALDPLGARAELGVGPLPELFEVPAQVLALLAGERVSEQVPLVREPELRSPRRSRRGSHPEPRRAAGRG